MQRYLLIASIFFVIAALLHLARAIIGWPVMIHHFSVPRAFSFAAGLLGLVMAFWGFAILYL